MSKLKTFAGIDISKDTFDVCLKTEEGKALKAFKLSYDQKGMDTLKGILPSVCICVMEATGPYYIRLAVLLHSEGYMVSVVNPLKVKRFSQMELSRTKTDKADAAMIADYAINQQHKLPQWAPPASCQVRLGQLSALCEGLIKQRTQVINQLHSFKATGQMAAEEHQLISDIIKDVESRIAQAEARMQKIIAEQYAELSERISTIPGIGPKAALMLIVISGGFKRFSSYRELIAYIGLAPRKFDSGTSVKGRGKVCKMGMSRVRAVLYVCAWSAKRYNGPCKALYERLVAAGKSKRLALIAVANKLIKQAFAIATQNTTYQPKLQKNICS
jgi:transposase